MLSYTIRDCVKAARYYPRRVPTACASIVRRSYATHKVSADQPVKIIGIDLGTTNSAVAIVEGEKPRILENSQGARTTPSVVAFTRKGDVLVGVPAKRQATVNSQNTFYATKRLIGRKFDDAEVQKDISHVPYKIVKHENGDAWLQTSVGEDIAYSPSQIGGFVLKEMKKIAETNLGSEIKNSVITVPAYFNDSQRQATKTAGELVGLNVVRIVNEPTSASLAYGLNQQKDGIVAVYDLGGGTFDISILDIEDGVFEVRSTNGDTHLGGEDFDNVLVKYIVDRYKSTQKGDEDITANRMAMQRIKDAAEKAKIELSHVHKTTIKLPFITKDEDIDFELTEKELDEMTMHLIKRTIAPLKKALSDADLEKSDIDEVILVGGMTRMPRIRKMVGDFFNKEPNTQVNPDEAVALGAAIQGAVLSGEVKDVLLLDVTPLTLGIETYGGLFSPLIPRNTTVPCKIQTTYSTAVDGQNSIDINVYQGERPLVQDNKLIGKFKLAGIPPKPKGVPKIQVSFDIDADGIIKVSAVDKDSGKEASITVFGKTGMSKEEIDNLVNQSKESIKEDQMRLNYLKHVNNLELIVFDSEQAMTDWKKFISKDEEGRLSRKLEIVKSMIDDSRKGDLFDVDLIKAAQDELKDETMEIIQSAGQRSREAK
ncbi:DEKNAAC102452 [Brettanomyces naardenensis]|uniref:Iron-sulfur cluster biogenesis chaperone, mitochondrial n=1 Tax=Brettanomyces naardenensis TaxID=13370 RepID=A0A448YKS9_BRENA|nr:DEKNAAC102452 [Brettanomyces naardenensis]